MIAPGWVFFYRLNGRQRDAGLGGANYLGLAKAREKRHDVHEQSTSSALAYPTHALRNRARERMLSVLLSLGHADLLSIVFPSTLDARLVYLERCSIEARAVLAGDRATATRLWLLLREPVADCFPIPDSVLSQMAGDAAFDAPIAIDEDYLLTLVAGTVRAANQPANRDAMLESLARLIDALLLIECAARAVERASAGYASVLRTLSTAAHAPDWRSALDHCVVHAGDTVPQADVDPGQRATDRAPFDPPARIPPRRPQSALDREL